MSRERQLVSRLTRLELQVMLVLWDSRLLHWGTTGVRPAGWLAASMLTGNIHGVTTPNVKNRTLVLCGSESR